MGYCYLLFTMMAISLTILSIAQKAYKRSVSTFIITVSFCLFVLTYSRTGNDLSWIFLCIGLGIIHFRMMYKKDNDKILPNGVSSA